MSVLLKLVFWVAALVLLHVYFLYPGVLFVLGSILDRSVTNEVTDGRWPSVSLVIAAYNEEEIIEQKIKNSFELDYPEEKLEIVVFSDASSDDTDQIVRSYEDEGVRLERIEGRVGKTACQNKVTERLDSDIVVFSDADSMYEEDAIKRLIEKFGPNVGCVVGELCYDKYGVEAESAYRTFEKLIRRLEPTVSSAAGANGSIYAVKRSSYVPLPPDQISDFAEPLAIVQRGERVEYTSEARAWENTGENVESEMSRRIRIATRSWHTFFDYVDLLNPVRYPFFSFELASHWVLRWFSPLLLAVVGLSNLLLVALGDNPLYLLLLAGQAGFYLLATVGWALNRSDLSTPRVAYVPYYFLVLNYSLLVALGNVVRNRNIVTWETETRTNSD
ncbi:Glycosyltransferase, catalytic subunit of cellulose synthase and poly-beta-1,6-N-acetylglucosamine synthase [Halopelagius inordinatus]|uniref:Glycosyltransferase, catalytic subunit of cellulose synthase and poly-beta-1,6-N-acetylglucosamine synthase n=1 Tax=Halopelagius inordinatus TaxID=553467 RepID=A0A1I2U7N9_9EURY|nr:glycosyltransferase family 2 protein [Halopelagius inordinatus]SFG73144.1 Glycosyltransferase, catalytic subunit of cellulose synthase and poly-beta-1,6-N-acetylglucosamine synthase [Halopelagius inordinatus]